MVLYGKIRMIFDVFVHRFVRIFYTNILRKKGSLIIVLSFTKVNRWSPEIGGRFCGVCPSGLKQLCRNDLWLAPSDSFTIYPSHLLSRH